MSFEKILPLLRQGQAFAFDDITLSAGPECFYLTDDEGTTEPVYALGFELVNRTDYRPVS